MRPLRLIAAAGILGIAAAPPAMAAWSPPQRASTGPGDAHSPDVAVNGRGDGIAAWVQETGRRGRIVASTRGTGGRWSPPEPVSPAGPSAIDPRVAVNGAGTMVVAWRQVVRTRILLGRRQAVYVARARERTPRGAWGPVATLSDDRQKVGPPEVAVDGRGVAIATWHWGTGTRAGTPGHVGEIQLADKRPGRSWSRPRSVSRAGGGLQETRLPRVRVGRRGHAVVFWQRDLGRRGSTAEAVARGPAPAGWSRPQRLPFETSGDLSADVAVRPDGSVLALSASARGRLAALTWWRGSADAGGLSLRRLSVPPVADRALSGPGRLGLAAAEDGSTLAVWASDLPPSCSTCSSTSAGAFLAGDGSADEFIDVSSASLRVMRSLDVALGAGGWGLAAALDPSGLVTIQHTPASSASALALWDTLGYGPLRLDGGPQVGADDSGGGSVFYTRIARTGRIVERMDLVP